MSVYVDDLMACIPNRNWRWTHSCHLFADGIEELHQFAKDIGLKRAWFQYKKGKTPHYDLNENMRSKAIRLGAVEIDRRQAAEIIRSYGLCGECEKPCTHRCTFCGEHACDDCRIEGACLDCAEMHFNVDMDSGPRSQRVWKP